MTSLQASIQELYDADLSPSHFPNATARDFFEPLDDAKEHADDVAAANDQPHKITSAKIALTFMLAGNAYFTVRSTKTGTRYTFRIAKAKDDKNSERFHADTYFVSMLTGSSNESDYSYMGIIRDKQFRTTARSRFVANSTPVLAFKWMFSILLADHMPSTMELWHEGRCGRCGRKLTVPESIEAGIGPECATRMQ